MQLSRGELFAFTLKPAGDAHRRAHRRDQSAAAIALGWGQFGA